MGISVGMLTWKRMLSIILYKKKKNKKNKKPEFELISDGRKKRVSLSGR
jgi:hypothetical protein